MEETKSTTGATLDSNENLERMTDEPTESEDDNDHSTQASTYSALPDLQVQSGEWNTSSSLDCINQKHITGRIYEVAL